jgi:tryptophanyl-tRNA synthetase
MAADILLYQTDVVPVGEDQKQHVEIAADIAKRFNHRYGEVFKIPQVKLVKETSRIMSLTDPKNKMSKSGEDKARINLSDADDVIMKKIMSAVTDSGKEIEYREDKPAIANLLRIYSACSGEPIEEIVVKFKNNGYADFKNSLAEVIIKKISPIREKKIELEKDEESYKKIIFEGLEKAEIISRETLEKAKKTAGLI